MGDFEHLSPRSRWEWWMNWMKESRGSLVKDQHVSNSAHNLSSLDIGRRT